MKNSWSWLYFLLSLKTHSMKGREISTLNTTLMMTSTSKISNSTKYTNSTKFYKGESGNISTISNRTQFKDLLRRNLSSPLSNKAKFPFNCGNSDDNCEESLEETAEFMCEKQFSPTHNETFRHITQIETPYENFYSRHFFAYLAILSNIVTIIIIAVHSNLRKPFYLSILSLAFADILCILYEIKYVFNLDDLCSYRSSQKIFDVYKYSTKLNGKLNMTLLAIVRYCMFVYPLKSRAFLRNKYIGISSVICVLLSGVYGYCIVFYFWRVKGLRTRTLLIVTDDMALIVFFIVINIFFFIHRFKTAKRSRAAEGLKVKMTIVVIVILILSTVDSIISLAKQLLELPVVDTGLVELPVVDTGLAELPVVDTGFTELPVVDTGLAELPVVNTGLAELPVSDSGLTELPLGSWNLSELPTVNMDYLKIPVVDNNLSKPLSVNKAFDESWLGFLDYVAPYYYIFVHGINPFLYFFSSPAVKTIFSSILKCFRGK